MTFNKLKIVHLHTDYKFVSDSKRFDGNHFNNTIIYISNNNLYNDQLKENVLCFKNNKKDKDRIVDICNHCDLIVLNDLSTVNMKIALTVLPDIKIFWRFFGHELYGRISDFCYSEKTKIARKQKLHETITNFLNPHSLIKLLPNSRNLFKRTAERINYFLCFSTEEYDLLKDHFPSLPPLIKLNLQLYSGIIASNLSIRNIVVLGNNRSAYNNHLDLIDMIMESEANHNVEFHLLFNYGPENKYTKSVRKKALNSTSLKLIEEFMSRSEYMSYYQKVCSLVINGHRQMALGNVFEALKNGVKIYLNERNVILSWLRNQGFVIFTIMDFQNDLKTGNFQLSEAESKYNIEQLIKISSAHTADDFQNAILKAIGRC
jgi:hypothetical protein